MYKQQPDFRNRYRITGTLVAKSPVHVGDGERLRLSDRPARFPPDYHDTDYSSFVSGANGAVLIPGSTLKGILRAWLVRRGAPQDLLESVFGTQDAGGKAEFHDAPLTGPAQGSNDYRWWDGNRGTCLAPGVSLDPRTGTAKDQLLYYTEFAPEGSKFVVTVTAGNLIEDERNLLLYAFEAGFRDKDDPPRVGAETADGWGVMEWLNAKCEVIQPGDVKGWLDVGAASSYQSLFHEITAPVHALAAPALRPALLLDVRLIFQGAVLVNDPSQFRKRNENTGDPGVGSATVRRRNGSYFLPGSSVRGALRSQLRRIWQTLAHEKPGDLNSAKQVEAKRSQEQTSLAALLRMMGAPGWKAPVTVPDFELQGTARLHRQEFVAIDRFLGGAAEEKKFSAQGLYAPEFRATISIDLDAWKAASVGGWAVLLLLFLLRDLQEGDIRFGFGSSKGYGVCAAQMEVKRRGDIPAEFGGNQLDDLVRGILARSDEALRNARLAEWEQDLVKLLETAA